MVQLLSNLYHAALFYSIRESLLTSCIFSDGKEKAKIPDTKVCVAGSETVPATGEAELCRFVPRRHLADLALLVLGETRDVKLCSNYIKESISPIPMYVDSMSKDKCVDPGLR